MKTTSRRRTGRSALRLIPYAGRQLGRLARYGFTAAAARSAVRAQQRSGQGVTVQKDRANIYRRKRAPRRTRFRRRKANRLFRSKLMKMKGSRTLITNKQVVAANLANKQMVISFVLYGGRADGAGSATARGYDDMEDLRKRDYLLGDNSGDLQARVAGGECRWFTKTGIMDMTIQNTSEGGIGIEMDIYEFYCGVMDQGAGPDVETAIQFYNQDVIMQGASSAKMETMEQTDRGTTPFEFGGPMSKFRMKITRKTKYFIPYGDVITYQIRDSKLRQFDHSVYRNNSPTTRHTRGVYIVAKPLPAQADSVITFNVGCTRKYKYFVDMSHTVRAAYWDPVS